jgi:hypothetical protein
MQEAKTMSATALLVTSPSTPSAGVSVSATILFNGTEVTINSQNIENLKKNGLVFSLTNPVPMGSFADLIDWMNKNLHLPLTSHQIETYIAEVPDPFSAPLNSLFNAIITLTVLNINTNTSLYQVAVTIAPQPPINILNILEVTAIGIQVSSGTQTSP